MHRNTGTSRPRLLATCGLAVFSLLLVPASHGGEAQQKKAGGALKKTLAWLKRLDAEKYPKPRFGSLNSVEDLNRVSGLSLGGHVRPDGKHIAFAAGELANLVPLPSLTKIMFMEATVPDSELKTLATIDRLTYLSIDDAPITDTGARHLLRLRRLTHLGLTGAKITDAFLSRIGNLKELEWLALDGTQISDGGLRSLQNLPRLKKLGLSGTGITDKGLASLAKIKSLEMIYISKKTRLTPRGIKAFEAKRPGCKVTTDWAAMHGNHPFARPVLMK